MKKTFLFLAVLCMAVLCHAQPEVGTLSIQPKVGINVANITHGHGTDPRVGVVGGIELQSQLASYVGVSYGILYSMQGARAENGSTKSTLKLDYVNIPIMANVYLYKGLALKAGIQPGFNVVDKYKVSNGGQSVTGSIADLGFKIKSFDFGIPFGLSYEFNRVVLDARYILGMTEFAENDDDNSHHRVFQFTIGYRFSR